MLKIPGGRWLLLFTSIPFLLSSPPAHARAAATVRLVAEVVPASEQPFLRSPGWQGITVAGKTFFAAQDETHGFELWVSDGTSEGTRLLRDISLAQASSRPDRFVEFQGHVFFTATDDTHGRELWRTDGTSEGTVLIADTVPGAGGGLDLFSAGQQWAILSGRLYFLVTWDGEWFLWQSDGTAVGTEPLLRIGLDDFDEPSPFLARVGNSIVFPMDTAELGSELWALDAGSRVPRLLADINPGEAHAFTWFESETLPQEGTRFLAANHRLFFKVIDNQGHALWVTDGTSTGTVRLATRSAMQFDILSPMHPFDGLVFFVAWTAETGHEIWVTDGTPERTLLLRDVRPGSESSVPLHNDGVAERMPQFGTGAGLLAFIADDGEHGFEVWVSDGTTAGTRLLVDLHPGSGSAVVVEQFAPPLFRSSEFGDRLVFSASDGIVGRELWITDGTAAGTSLVRDINPGAGDGIDVFPFDPQQLVVASVGGEMFFAASDGVTFNALWRSNGSPQGTEAVFPGQQSGRYPSTVAPTDSGILFNASTEPGGLGLFAIESESSGGGGGGGGGGCAVVGDSQSGDAEMLVLALVALVLMLRTSRFFPALTPTARLSRHTRA